MATFTQQKDDIKTCPYNPCHKVAARRLQAHIVKCSRNPGNPVMQDCPFNALHKVLPEDMQSHILSCKDSRQVIREIEESRNRTPISRPVVRSELPPSSDDWDEEVDPEAKNYVIPGLSREDTQNGENGETAEFTIKSQIQIQCMTQKDRKKYYAELAEKAKAKELPEMKSEIRIKEEKERASASASSSKYDITLDDDNPNNVRNPTTIPFKNIMLGIGRGSTPLRNRSGMRSVGSTPTPLSDPKVKRERNDDLYSDSKRFSPDNSPDKH